MAGLATTQAAAIQSQLAYTRQQEAEADRIGMQTLVKAGFNPHAMPRFFEQLLRTQRFSSDPPQFLIDHPVTESRIADTRARADTLPSPPFATSLDFLLVRARLKALYIHDPTQAETYFDNLYQQGSNQQQLAAGYGLAIAAMRAQHYDRAKELLQTLSRKSPNTWWFAAGLAENAIAAGHYEQANQQLARLLQLMPGNYALSMLYAHSLLRSNQPAAAQALIQPQLLARPEDPLPWELSAQAFGAMKDSARAHLARGEYLFLSGQGKQGLQQLKYALKDSKDSFSLHSLVQARIDDMTAAEKQKF
jgi:predicted Zn-dependent protease